MRATRLTSAALALAATIGAGALVGAGAASAARYDDWNDTSGPEPVATIADLDTSSDAIAPGAAGGASFVDLSLRSTKAQHLRITVLDQAGRELRTIVDVDVQAGPGTWRWDGRDAAGAPVADGAYELVVEAGSARDSMSVSDIVHVDRRAPAISTPSLRVRVPRRAPAQFALPIVASEASLVDVAVGGAAGRGRTTSARPKGRSSLTVPVASRSALRKALRRGSATVPVRLVATDDAGNRTARSVNVVLVPETETSTGGDGGSGGSTTPAPTSGKVSWPLSGPLTSRFGPRWGRNHNGIDIGVPTGRPIGAAAPGRVTYAGWMSGYGNTVIIDHGSIETLYGHQSRITTHVGQNVTRGHVIGYVGSTGNSTGPHLHFEVRVGGVAKDPLRYLP